jgi:hypothetical protein
MLMQRLVRVEEAERQEQPYGGEAASREAAGGETASGGTARSGETAGGGTARSGETARGEAARVETSGGGTTDGGTASGAAAAAARTLVLATTHLKAGVSSFFEAVRARQAEMVLSAIDGFAGRDEVVALAGDMNAHPVGLAADNDGHRLDALAIPRLVSGGFRSAYDECGASPRWTNWSGWTDREVKVAFDHVMLRGGGVAPAAALTMPTSADVAASECRLPNANYPSDHVSLVVDLHFV